MSNTPNLTTDPLLLEIVDYVDSYVVKSDLALQTARHVLMDSLGCAFEGLDHPDCARLIGPPVPGATCPLGARVPGTSFILDPATAAFSTGAMVRWTDYSDTWLAPTTTHPSDDVGAMLAVGDYLSRTRIAAGQEPLVVKDVLEAMVKAHEIQGMLGVNPFNEIGIDHVLLVKVACAAVAAKQLGGNREQITAATSLAFFRPGLCVHRFGSNTGPRKSWAAAEAASDGVRLALMAAKGEPGYPQVLSHPRWGFSKVMLGGKEVRLESAPGCRVMENVIFKIVAPVVIHAQTGVECALKLHPAVRGRLDDIAEIRLTTHRRALDAIDKKGLLRNAADRDHSLQYPVAVALIHGRLTAEDYEDAFAADPRIDRLRALMTVAENPRYTESYRDPVRRGNPNAMEIVFKNGKSTGLVEFECPAGHPSRREEGIPLLVGKFERNLARRYPDARQRSLRDLFLDHDRLAAMPVNEFTDALAV